MKKIIIFSLFSLLFYSINSFADKPLVFDLTHTISSESPSSVDKELTPDIEKLLKKPLIEFGRKLQKKYKIRIVYEESDKKLKFINGIIVFKGIHSEYAHNVYSHIYSSTVKLTALIHTPKSKKEFEKNYTAQEKVKLGPQWSEWIGINRVTRFAIKEVLKKILDDEEFGKDLLAVDKESFFSKDFAGEKISEHKEKIQEDKPSSIEKRLKTLDSLKEKGLITEEEYKEKKKDILDEL